MNLSTSHNASCKRNEPLLRVSGISKSFARISVLRGIDFELRRGEVMMLAGENGAGKSTLKNILSGLIKPDAGAITFNGHSYPALTIADIEQLGIGTIHQELSLFANLTVAENIYMPHIARKRGLVDWKLMRAKSASLLRNTLGTDIDPNQQVSSLSLGERQLVEIAKAVHRSSSLLILDEPTTCLSITDRRNLFSVVRRLRDSGFGIIYITHFLEEIYELADKIVVLRDGQIAAFGAPAELPADALTRAMVGRELIETQIEPYPLAPDAPCMLKVSDVSVESLVRNVSFTLKRGEILGVAGLMGAGRSELAEYLVGLRVGKGAVEINGETYDCSSPRDALARGMVLVSEDRRKDQAFLGRPLRENITASSLGALSGRFLGLLRSRKERSQAQQVVATYGVYPPRLDGSMVNLSGGNQQKAIIGRWLSHHPRICILDEPTKGVDVGARAAIHRLITDLSKRGMAFLLISSDLPELLTLSHRALVLHKGSLVGSVNREDFQPSRILHMASTGSVR